MIGTPKILGKFFKMLKIGYGEDFKMSGRIYTHSYWGLIHYPYDLNITSYAILRNGYDFSRGKVDKRR